MRVHVVLTGSDLLVTGDMQAGLCMPAATPGSRHTPPACMCALGI